LFLEEIFYILRGYLFSDAVPYLFQIFMLSETIHKNERNFVPSKSRKNSKVIILTRDDLF